MDELVVFLIFQVEHYLTLTLVGEIHFDHGKELGVKNVLMFVMVILILLEIAMVLGVLLLSMTILQWHLNLHQV